MREIGGKVALHREGKLFTLVNNNDPMDCYKHEILFSSWALADEYERNLDKALRGYGLQTNIVVPIAEKMGASVKKYHRYYRLGMAAMTDWKQIF